MPLLMIIFIKRPGYSFGFFVIACLFLLATLRGNIIPAAFSSFASAAYWCYLTIALYISEKDVNSNFFGYDLKKTLPVAQIFLLLNGILLFVGWGMIISTYFPLDQMMQPVFVTFFPTVLLLSLGVKIMFAMIVYNVAKNGRNLTGVTYKEVFADIIKLIAQP